MSEEDRRKWDERHAAADLAADKAGGTAAPQFLAWIEARLPAFAAAAAPGSTALDVACGRGAATVALAERGYTVHAVDISLVALGIVRHRAAERGVAGRVRTLVCDLDAGIDGGLPPDLPAHDLVLCVHFHQPSRWPALRAAVAPGGLLAMETLTTANDDQGLGGPSRRFLVEPGRLRDAAMGSEANGFEVLAFEEGLIDGKVRARLLARRS